MFGNDERDRRISSLETELKELKQMVWALENKCADYRVGIRNPCLQYDFPDTRPSMTMRNAINQIMTHLKLEFVATDAVPASVHLQRKGAR